MKEQKDSLKTYGTLIGIAKVEILNYITKSQGKTDFDLYHNVGKNWFVKVMRNAE